MTTSTNSTESTDPQAIVDGYFACWNALDPDARAEAIGRTWAVDARSSDPLAVVAGHAELAAMFAEFHATYPGSSFRQKGGVDAHHELVRWGWEMIGPDGAVALDGIDVAVIGDGKIRQLAGFFGHDLPATR